VDRPVWLLDVDGVINVGWPEWDGGSRSGSAYSSGQEFLIRWAPALIERIRGLHERYAVDIRWCSTWCCDADQLERLFGLPALERAWTADINGLVAAAAKLAAARQVLAEKRRLIWTDDTEVPTDGPLYDELTRDGRALLIAPHWRRGLLPEHLDAIEAFV
jgi:hypothetical protein